jgi:hypothetical protein
LIALNACPQCNFPSEASACSHSPCNSNALSLLLDSIVWCVAWSWLGCLIQIHNCIHCLVLLVHFILYLLVGAVYMRGNKY